ncbi:MAG: arylsulfotransferase family protein [Myxococcota bacterium]
MDEPDLRAMTAAPTSPRSSRITACLVVAAVLVVHGVTLAGGFVYDDLWVVVNNPFLKDLSNFTGLWGGDLPAGLPDGNRPAAIALYMLDYAIFGLEPWGWHLQNLLWHLACALSVAWLARRLSEDERIARAAGLLFAVHAISSEAVAVVNYREDLVATTAICVAMALVVTARRSGRLVPVALACLALVFGSNAKEIVPTFPVLLAAYDACFFRGDPRSFLRRSAWVYLPLTLAAFGSRFWVDALLLPDVLSTAQGADALAPLAVVATAGKITLAYLGQLLLPIHLSADYATQAEEELGLVSVLGLVAVASLLGMALAMLRRRPVPAFGLLWLLIGLLPTSGIAPIQNLRADRYLYLPSVGYALVAGWALVSGCQRLAPSIRPRALARRALPAALAALCLVYGGLAFARNQVWRDEATLWEETLRTRPHSHRAQVALMSEYLRRGNLDDAEQIGRAASLDHPKSWQLQLNLGQVYLAKGRPRQALVAFERAVRLGGAGEPRLIDNLAVAHVRAGDAERGLALLQDAVERWPRDARMQQHLGLIAFEEKKFALAVRALEAAVALEPGNAESYHTLARSQLRRGKVDAARDAIERALAIAPDHVRSRQLAARIRRLAASQARPGEPAEPAADVSQSEIDRLRSLGYLDFADEIVLETESPVSDYDPQRSAPGYNLVTTRSLSRSELFDAQGRVLRSWSDPKSVAWSNAELTPTGHLLVQGVRGKKRLYLAKLGWDGRLIWRRWIDVHHDVEVTPDGGIAALTLEGRTMPELHPRLPLLDNGIALLDAQGDVLASYSLYEMLKADPGVFRFQHVAPTKLSLDLLHANSVELMRHPHLAARNPIYATGNALVSFRHQDTIAIFDLEARRVVWSWGQGEIAGPHDATVLENGNLLLFDNGLGRGWSRVVEVDPQSREIVWQYRAAQPRSFYSASEGSSQRLPNGNTLIANSDAGEAFEVTPEGDVVWRWRNPNADENGRRATIVRIKRYPKQAIDARIRAADSAGP